MKEETPQERVAIVMDRLVKGEELATVEIARMFELDRRSALAMMTRIERVVPSIMYDYDAQVWRYCGDG